MQRWKERGQVIHLDRTVGQQPRPECSHVRRAAAEAGTVGQVERTCAAPHWSRRPRQQQKRGATCKVCDSGSRCYPILPARWTSEPAIAGRRAAISAHRSGSVRRADCSVTEPDPPPASAVRQLPSPQVPSQDHADGRIPAHLSLDHMGRSVRFRKDYVRLSAHRRA